MPASLHRTIASAALLWATFVPPSGACTVCDSDGGERLRAGIADEDLRRNLLATALPFVLVGGAIALVHFAPPLPPRRLRRASRAGLKLPLKDRTIGHGN